MNKFFAASLGVLAFAGLSGTVEAAPLDTSFSVSVWHALTPGSNISSANQFALPTNPIVTPGNLIADFTYTGAMNFNTGVNTIAAFFASGGGAITGADAGELAALAGTDLSSGNFADATIMSFTFTTGAINGDIDHDDGISIFQGATLLVDSSAPTSVIETSFSLPAGTYTLWYAEVNGLPAILSFDATPVPEPLTLSLLGASLLGVGFAARRRRA